MLHLSYADQRMLIENFMRTDCRYIMLSTFPEAVRNRDIVTGEARPVNLRLPPISLPDPMLLIPDEGPNQSNRAMGVWETSQLRDWSWGT